MFEIQDPEILYLSLFVLALAVFCVTCYSNPDEDDALFYGDEDCVIDKDMD